MSYRSHCQGKRNEQTRKRERIERKRAAMWAKFYDVTSDALLRQPEPSYLYRLPEQMAQAVTLTLTVPGVEA
jgi:hypothetical protein